MIIANRHIPKNALRVLVIWMIMMSSELTSSQDSESVISFNEDYTELRVSHSISDSLEYDKSYQNLKVYFGSYSPNKSPVWGDYGYSDSAFTFKPRMPFQAGENYEAIVSIDAGQNANEQKVGLEECSIYNFTIPKQPRLHATEIVGVFPSYDSLPENLLRFHILFSKPMKHGRALDYIHLVDKSTGRIITNAFADFLTEMWDEDYKRLTVYLDPGRIKNGLVLHRNLGAPLKFNHRYQLLIEAAWQDVQGYAMSTSFVKEFSIVNSDTLGPQISNWEILTPSMDSKSPVVIHFLESVDRVLAASSIQIVDAQDKPVAGVVKITNNESSWVFYPERRWINGSYKILVYSGLSDPSGNMLKGRFERDLDLGDRLDSVHYYSRGFIVSETIGLK